MKTAIALFAFNRPLHLLRTLAALTENTGIERFPIYAFLDGPRRPEDLPQIVRVREILDSFASRFDSFVIHANEANQGLARSIISGVTHVLNQYDQVIVLEDDIVTSSGYLNYIEACLDYYKGASQVLSVTGYQFPLAVPATFPYDAYLAYRCNSWGWATWKDRWQSVDWSADRIETALADRKIMNRLRRGGPDLERMLRLQLAGRIDSWAIRWGLHHAIQDGYCLFPTRSKVLNIGHDGSGIHCEPNSKHNSVVETLNPSAPLRLPSAHSKSGLELAHQVARFHRESLLGKLKRNLVEIVQG